jgi:ribonucleoside-diphosphate reductase alpha chain
MEAWKQGCKGLTIYVDECRTGVLVSNDTKKEDEFKQHNAPKRPKELECAIHTTTIKGQKYYVLIGLLNSKPYEVFAIKDEIHHFSDTIGFISKHGKGKYSVREGNSELGWVITESLTDEEETITRLVSTSLRHGADIKFIVEQLNKTKGDLTQYGKAISRILKKYIADNQSINEKCPECGANLIYKDGCISCTCGYSKCG